MKLEGMLKPKEENTNIINLIENISSGKSRLKDKIHNANFTEVDDDGKV